MGHEESATVALELGERPFTIYEAADAGVTVVADHLLRVPRPEFKARSEPYATPEDLADMLDRHWGTPGIRKARLPLEQARVGSDSAPEPGFGWHWSGLACPNRN